MRRPHDVEHLRIRRVTRAQRTIATIAIGHFAVDYSAQLLTMMYPLLAAPLGMSLGMTGLAALVWALTSSIPQPMFGYLGDRIGRRWIAAGGLAWMATWISLASLAPSYPIFVVCLALGGFGSAAFHPQGAATANEAVADRKGASVATFFLGGHLGFAVSPLVAGLVLSSGDVQRVVPLVAPAVLVAVFVAIGLRGARAHAHAQAAAAVASTRVLVSGIIALLSVVFVRGWAYASVNTFAPFVISPDRPDPARAGAVLAVFLAMHAFGAFTGGIVADRLGVRRVLAASSAASIPLIVLFGWLPFDWYHLLFAAGIGGAIGVGFTPTILLMQRMVPRRMGAASGIALGVSFASGAVGNAVTGVLGDAVGLPTAFAVIAIGQGLVFGALRWVPTRTRLSEGVGTPRTEPIVSGRLA